MAYTFLEKMDPDLKKMPECYQIHNSKRKYKKNPANSLDVLTLFSPYLLSNRKKRGIKSLALTYTLLLKCNTYDRLIMPESERIA